MCWLYFLSFGHFHLYFYIHIFLGFLDFWTYFCKSIMMQICFMELKGPHQSKFEKYFQ